MTTLGLARIAFGLVAVAWTLSLLQYLDDFFGPRAVQIDSPAGGAQWTLLSLAGSERALFALWCVLLAGSAALTLGWHSRIAALVVFVGVMSFERRNGFVFNAGDALVRIEALFMVLGPCGAALSLDRRRTAGSFWSAQIRAPWVVRLMQVQLSLIYLSSVREKLTGPTWNDGTAVSYALRLPDLAAFSVPAWLSADPLLMNLATWGTLALEVGLGILIWSPRWRWWILAAGVVMHTFILLSLAVAFFTVAMFVLYIAFIPPDVASRRVSSRRIGIGSTETRSVTTISW
ncbi:MAG TPA: HTTM domain-containing protein [Aeromicrobium sp.]|nr:HTTM domain-containing protein [Aeromicrobium sp.]